VFWLIADGMRYRAIASALEIPVKRTRNASRSCERKRERFQPLYDTGRLCGYSAATIQALQGGEVTSEEVARRAFAHLEVLRKLPSRAQDQRQTARPHAPARAYRRDCSSDRGNRELGSEKKLIPN
jgi:hypothetical protein